MTSSIVVPPELMDGARRRELVRFLVDAGGTAGARLHALTAWERAVKVQLSMGEVEAIIMGRFINGYAS